jgi:hypothetical protein
MPQKKAKKAPKKLAAKLAAKPAAEKAKKPVKLAKPSGLGVALKTVTKNVVKSVMLGAAKKTAVAPAPAKKAIPVAAAKHDKIAKKAEPIKKGAPAAAPEVKGKAAPAPLVVKGKKAEPTKAVKVVPAQALHAAKVAAPVVKGVATIKAKAKDVVVEVPAPKGVAILAKEAKGTKKAKAAEAAAAARQRRCREPGCEHEFVLVGYCRMHYIKNWRRIKRKEAILASGQLNNYVEELVNKYPDKYLDVIRQDLATEKEWGKVVVDLELEATDEEGGAEEDIDAVAEGVRPASGGGGSRGEFDDEGDAF